MGIVGIEVRLINPVRRSVDRVAGSIWQERGTMQAPAERTPAVRQSEMRLVLADRRPLTPLVELKDGVVVPRFLIISTDILGRQRLAHYSSI